MIRSLVLFSILVQCALSTGCSTFDTAAEAGCLTVKQALKLARTDEQAEVKACGVLRYQFEDMNLYATELAASKHSREDCISLGKSKDYTEGLEALNGSYVRVSGLATSQFCPAGTICTASCSDAGIFVRDVEAVSSQ